MWLCTLSQYQPRYNDSIRDKGPTIAEQLALDPFTSVLCSSSVEFMAAIHTTTANLYDRLWCPFEMSQALSHTVDVAAAPSKKYRQRLIDKFNYFVKLADGDGTVAFEMFSLQNLKVKTETAQCTSKDDE